MYIYISIYVYVCIYIYINFFDLHMTFTSFVEQNVHSHVKKLNYKDIAYSRAVMLMSEVDGDKLGRVGVVVSEPDSS